MGTGRTLRKESHVRPCKTPAGKAETGMTEKAEAAETAETETVATESVAVGETRREHESSAKPETDRATAKNDAEQNKITSVTILFICQYNPQLQYSLYHFLLSENGLQCPAPVPMP